MKVKIKGLVFVGFAAAVFAQSAMAEATADAKTVTSKLYVDTTFQTLNNITTTSELTVGGSVTQQAVDAHWASNSEYPSMAVLKSVKDTVTGMRFSGDELYIDANTSNGATTISLDTTNLAGDAAAITATGTATSTAPAPQDKLVKASAVNDYAQAKADRVASINNDSTDTNNYNGNSTTKYTSVAAVTGYAEANANKVTAIVTDSTNANYNITSNTAYPTTKAVYDFVTTQGGAFQPKVTDTGDNLKVGYLGSGTGATPTWKTIKGASTGTGSTTDYVTINQDGTSGVYEVNLDGAQLAAAATDLLNANSTSGVVTALTAANQVKLVEASAVEGLIAYETSVGTTTITNADSGNGKVPTVKNVYDFVNGSYQAKAAANTNTVQIGYNATWGTLSGDSTYITVNPNSGSATVSLGNLTEHGVSDTGATPAYTTDFVAAGTTNASTKRPMLARAGDVYDFVMDQMGGLAIPEMPQDCTDAAEAGGSCALVYGLVSGSGANATYGLQWTVMAPVPANNG